MKISKSMKIQMMSYLAMFPNPDNWKFTHNRSSIVKKTKKLRMSYKYQIPARKLKYLMLNQHLSLLGKVMYQRDRIRSLTTVTKWM